MTILDFNPSSVLQDQDLTSVESELNNNALLLALLGEVDVARQLISMQKLAPPLNDWTHCTLTCMLAFAWEATGKLPDGLSEDAHQSDLEGARSAADCDWCSIVHCDRAGLEELLRPLGRNFLRDTDHASSADVRLVKALEVSLQRSNNASRLMATASVNKADLDDLSISILDALICTNHNDLSAMTFLAHSDYLWPFYARGLLRDALDMKQTDVQKSGTTILNTFRARLASARAPKPFADMNLSDLLKLGESSTLEIVDHCNRGTASEWMTLSCLHPPADDQEVSALEDALSVTLPDDYLDFLKISNGFGHDDDSLHVPAFTELELHSIRNVEWLEDDWIHHPVELLTLPHGFEDHVRTSTFDLALHRISSLPCYDRVIEIGKHTFNHIWLIPQDLVAEARTAYREMYHKANELQRKTMDRAIDAFAGSKQAFEQLEWCVVEMRKHGRIESGPYPDFRTFLERKIWLTSKRASDLEEAED